MFLVGLLAGWITVTRLAVPVWGGTVLVIATVLYPMSHKWRTDLHHYGFSIMIMSILLVAQSFHTLEHIVQWVQYYYLGMPLRLSSGLISPLNAEIVHFIWNWLVTITVVYLIYAGQRNLWMWLLLGWATAHTAEHTYIFISYLRELERLAQFGVPLNLAQGLPGIIGKGGWLARRAYELPIAYYICELFPVVKTAPRLDVHFWWNIGEVFLLLLGGNSVMRSCLSRKC